MTTTNPRLTDAGFRAFDECDWDAFCGCESDNPLIKDDDPRFTIVLDGTTINVNSENGDHADIYVKQFPTRALAEDIALIAVASPETVTPRRFELLFGEPCGEV
jgi:hypothetical protein